MGKATDIFNQTLNELRQAPQGGVTPTASRYFPTFQKSAPQPIIDTSNLNIRPMAPQPQGLVSKAVGAIKNIPRMLQNNVFTNPEKAKSFQASLPFTIGGSPVPREEQMKRLQDLAINFIGFGPTRSVAKPVIRGGTKLIGAKGFKIGSVSERVAKSIHPDDLRIMSDFTDFVAGDYKLAKKEALKLELAVTRIAERYGLKMPKTTKGLAYEFGRVLEEQGFKRPLVSLPPDLPKESKGLIQKSGGTRADPLINKVMLAIKEAKPVRAEQEAIYTKLRGEKLSKALEVGKRVKGEAGFYAEKAQLEGKFPKLQFGSIKNKFNQNDIDELFIKVKDSPILNEWDKLPAREGLSKMFSGQVPTRGELQLLEKVYGSEFVKTILDKRSLFSKVTEAGFQLLNIPRSIIASLDMSAGFRQGIVLSTRYPKQAFSAFVNQFKYFGSENAFRGLQESIARKPTFNLMRESKLALTDLDNVLTAREERFMSNWAEKIPVLGRGVRASSRAYTGFLNKLRADVFDDVVRNYERAGLQQRENVALLKDLAGFINNATGRGSLGALERGAVPLNTFLFSPRLIASRLNLLNPYYYVKLKPPVRRLALESLFTFAGTGLTVLGLAKMAGADVGIDPRSADFGKIKIGNTRIDLWGGFQQYIKLAAQLISGQLVSSTTGKIYTLGEGYRPLTRLDILQRAAEYKEAPIPYFVTSLLRGQTLIGEPLSIKSETAKLFVPLAIKDIFELIKEHQAKGIPLAPLPFFGIGVQTFKSEPKKKSKTKSKKKIREPILPKGFK